MRLMPHNFTMIMCFLQSSSLEILFFLDLLFLQNCCKFSVCVSEDMNILMLKCDVCGGAPYIIIIRYLWT